jgi:hypothetical protein
MNSKKAKRIRQLVKHLQDKGAIQSQDWIGYVPQDNGQNLKPPTVRLDRDCGRAVYQLMKKNA